MKKPLRDYQEHGIRLIGEEYKKGHRAVCFVMGTGLGKTRTIGEVCARHIAKSPDAKIVWLAHREELVGQAFDALEELGLSCGVIQSVPCRTVNPHRPVQVASIQTHIARKTLIQGVTMAVHDEAHHGPSAAWREVPLHYKRAGAFIIGPTATAVRSDGLGLGDIYDSIVCPITVRQAIDRGYLCPFELSRPKHALKSGQIAQSPVAAYLSDAPGRKTIVFSGNISAGEHHLQEFLVAGIPAAMVHGKMDAGTRRRVLDDYRNDGIKVLVNCSVLTEGFDDPPTSCVIIARAVRSLSLWIQMCGRALRVSPGKDSAFIIDLHGSSHTLESPDKEHDWQLVGDAVHKEKAK